MDKLITIEGPGPLAPIAGPIDWTKPVQTKGRKLPVTIYAIDHRLSMPVVGRYEGDDDMVQWQYNGRFHRRGGESGLDLENVPEVQP